MEINARNFGHRTVAIVHFTDQNCILKTAHCIRCMMICKDGKKVNILCIVDRNHERHVVVLDHFSKFEGI